MSNNGHFTLSPAGLVSRRVTHKKPNDQINAQMVNGQMVNDLVFDIFGLRLGFGNSPLTGRFAQNHSPEYKGKFCIFCQG